MSKNNEIYKLTTTIHDSQAMNMNELTYKQAIDVVNELRQHVRTLIKELYLSKKDSEEIKKIAKMFQRIDEAKERVFRDAVYDKICTDSNSITTNDARQGVIPVATAVESEITQM